MTPIPFLRRLAANNNRPWFQQHKAEFDDVRRAWIADVNRFIAACSQWEPAYAYLSAERSILRIYRDTRFSADKTPYKTYMAASLTPRGRAALMAGVYISASVDKSMNGLFGGLWCPDAAMLRKMRRAIVDNIEEWEEIVNAPALTPNFPEWCGEQLKTIPKGWPREHPQAPYLRLLHYGREFMVDDDFWADPAWPERAAEILEPLKPLIDFINYTLFEEE